MKEILAELEKIKAPQNWDEITGPFFHIKLPNSAPKGPYIGAQLKHVCEMLEFPEDTLVRDAKNIGDWVNLYNHPTFQRRKPQVVGEDSEISQDRHTYVLVDGQKYGPFNLREITEQLDNGDLLLTDLVSLDDGHTWKKLYQYSNFDRRSHTQEQLPSAPGWEVFNKSNKEIGEHLEEIDSNELDLDAMAGLAFLENRHHQKVTVDHSEAQNEDLSEADVVPFTGKKVKSGRTGNEKNQSDQSKKTRAWAADLGYAMAIVLLLGSAVFLFTNDPLQNQKIVHQTEAVKSRRVANKVVEAKRVDDNHEEEKESVVKKSGTKSRTRSARARRNIPTRRQPASLTENEDFRDQREMEDRPYEDNQDPYAASDDYNDNYDYDDGDTPVTQDKIRKKLDKRTVDSEEEYYDDEERDLYRDDAPDTAAGIWEEESDRTPSNDEAYDDYDDSYEQEQYEEDYEDGQLEDDIDGPRNGF